jgi:hypothetical protein
MVDKRNTIRLGGYMPKRNAYERRGNNNERTVREKASANKPITRREMREAFEAWKKDKAKGDTHVCRTHIYDPRLSRRKRDKDSDEQTDKGRAMIATVTPPGK